MFVIIKINIMETYTLTMCMSITQVLLNPAKEATKTTVLMNMESRVWSLLTIHNFYCGSFISWAQPRKAKPPCVRDAPTQFAATRSLLPLTPPATATWYVQILLYITIEFFIRYYRIFYLIQTEYVRIGLALIISSCHFF